MVSVGYETDDADPFDDAEEELLRREIDKGLEQLDRGEVSPLSVLDILARERREREGRGADSTSTL